MLRGLLILTAFTFWGTTRLTKFLIAKMTLLLSYKRKLLKLMLAQNPQ